MVRAEAREKPCLHMWAGSVLLSVALRAHWLHWKRGRGLQRGTPASIRFTERDASNRPTDRVAVLLVSSSLSCDWNSLRHIRCTAWMEFPRNGANQRRLSCCVVVVSLSKCHVNIYTLRTIYRPGPRTEPITPYRDLEFFSFTHNYHTTLLKKKPWNNISRSYYLYHAK